MRNRGHIDRKVTVAKASAIPIVGIGASAGGIEALSLFFKAMPPDSGCAFAVVLHLDPKRESEMARILGTHTAMSVVQVENGMRIETDHVYVIAPDTDLKVHEGGLRVARPSEARGQRHPVDVLFRSIAGERRERAIAVVLSGTGSDGTDGLKEIRAEGGMSLVQAPETARFDGMPRSAIAAGMADHILAPEEMPENILRYIRHGYVSAPAEIEPITSNDVATLDHVLELLRVRTGHDFRRYKRSTQQRRVHRRMGLRNIETLNQYMDKLRQSPDEVAALATDLMISVTGFFRDAEAWKALSDLVITPMVAERQSGAAIRIWVPACATGEEAYSVAMLVTEQAEAAGKRFELKVFATDVQDHNLRKSRDGIYPAAAMAAFPSDRLRRFFDKLDGSIQVSKELRDMVVFAAHNLLRDPPFSRLDLVSCRNLLIYLEPEAQQRIIANCHFGLRQGGHLFLGNAETVGRHADLFETVSKKWRIYRRVGSTRHDLIEYPQQLGSVERGKFRDPLPLASLALPVAEIARRALLERYAPGSVLIDQKGCVLYFHGATSVYLEQPPGEPTRDILAMVHDGLATKLRAAIREASNMNRSVTVDARIRQGGAGQVVAMTVIPVPASARDGKLLLVSFAPGLPTYEPGEATIPEDAGDRALQEELTTARAELRNTIEHLETANEELKASNEEATSVNEELQSTNEELETSKEELQSFNEELNTVNSQLQHKIAELERATNDLNNLLAGSEIATLFLDEKFRIKWFTPATKELFDLVSSDVGRPITHFAQKFSDEDLLQDAVTVLKTLTTIEAEVQGASGRWYLRRMLPYRTRDNQIAGVVATFSDTTDRKHAADAINEARVYSEAIIGTIRQPLLVLDGDLRILSANSAFCDLFKVPVKETVGRLVYELGDKQWNIPRLRTLLDEVLSKNQTVVDFEVDHDFRDIGRRYMLLNARKLVREGGRQELILLAIEDITQRRESEDALRASEAQYRTLFDSIDEGFCVIEKTETAPGAPIDFRYVEANPAFERQTGVGGVVGKTIREAFPGELQEWFDTYDAVLRSGDPTRFERGLLSQGRVLELYAFRVDGLMQRRVAVIFQDITERKRGEDAIRRSEQRLQDLIEALPGAIYTTDAAGRITSYNPAAAELWGRSPVLGTDEWCGSWRLYRPDGTPLPHDECAMATALKEKRAIRGAEAVAERTDGVRVPFLAYPTPLRDATGVITGAVNMLVDITERKRAEALAERLAAIVASSDDAIISRNLEGIITSWNIGAARLFGYTAEEIVGKSIMTLIPSDRRDEEADILARVRRAEHIEHYETVRQRKDGSKVWVSLSVSPLKDSQGKVIGASKIARDMTERQRADEHRKVLVGELNHRVKNTLAVVQSIAAQTLGHAATMEEARDAFGSRLINLAKAHDVLTRENWAGADLTEIVVDTVEPHAGGENRFLIEGPRIQLAPSAALAFSMALHELATNAAKYGALSSEEGHVEIGWHLAGTGEDRRLNLSWSETGGPLVTAPTRKGFGSRLIERALAAELNGIVRVAYEPPGLVCTIDAPMPEHREKTGDPSAEQQSQTDFDRRG